jgi:hypothetical protein
VAPCDVSERRESVEVLDRRPRQKDNPLLLAQVDQRVRPAVAGVVTILDRHNRGRRLRSTQLILVDVGQPNVADLALLLQRDQSADRVFERHVRVGPMELIQGDLVQPQASQAALTCLPQMFRPSVGLPLSGAGADKSTLGRDDRSSEYGWSASAMSCSLRSARMSPQCR